jgi:hypothetical protein
VRIRGAGASPVRPASHCSTPYGVLPRGGDPRSLRATQSTDVRRRSQTCGSGTPVRVPSAPLVPAGCFRPRDQKRVIKTSLPPRRARAGRRCDQSRRADPRLVASSVRAPHSRVLTPCTFSRAWTDCSSITSMASSRTRGPGSVTLRGSATPANAASCSPLPVDQLALKRMVR